jgi:tripartite-type tricarboxylate transporter receptor subunit TctC
MTPWISSSPCGRRILLALILCAGLPRAALADTFPSRPVRLIVGFAPGSATDSFTRVYADKLAEALKTTVIVDNKASGAQAAAIQALLMAPPDGYTLYIGTGSSMAQGPGLRRDVRHDPLRDFSLIGHLATAPGALIVNAELPFKTVDELIAYARANPGKLSFGSSGVGAAGHLSGELFMARTGTRMEHVPYKADTEAARDVGAGTLQLAFTTLRSAATVVGNGKIRALLTLDAKRSPLLADVPSVTEATAANLKDIAPYTWYALVGPAKMPEHIVAHLSEASARAVAQSDYVKAMHNAGVNPESSTPAGLRAIVNRELAKWRDVAKTVKID